MNNVIFLLLGVFLGWLAHDLFIDKPQLRNPASQLIKQVSNPEHQVKKASIKTPVARTIPAVLSDDYAPEHLMNKAHSAIQNSKYRRALIHLENLLTQVQARYPQREVEALFIGTAKRYLQQLGDNNPQEKIVFLNKALDILPNELRFHQLLANLFLTLEDYPQVQYHLSFLVNNINWKSEFDSLQAQLDYVRIFEQGEIEIPLIKLTNAWHIEVVVDGIIARFVLDTGASSTVVSEHLIGINHQRLGKVVVSTANGTLDAFKVRIKRFSVGDVSKNAFTMIVLPKDKLPTGIDGLLGLDWFSKFDFVIDKKNALLRLTPVVN